MNEAYQKIIRHALYYGAEAVTRNHAVLKSCFVSEFGVGHAPLVTLRKTAWKKALREFEWFMSGDPKCPDELLDWWDGQLNPRGCYLDGYSAQFRCASSVGTAADQIANLLAGLREHPNSRRHVLTTWNAADMANITRTNENPRTPTCCHGSLVQFHVVGKYLHMYHYQRSADLLLGLPHNLVQYRALLHFVAFHTGFLPGTLTYKLGDAHIYHEASHLEAARAIATAQLPASSPRLIYQPPADLPTDPAGVPWFRAEDFSLDGKIPEPVTKIRPKLIA